jgi:hypothetical protein
MSTRGGKDGGSSATNTRMPATPSTALKRRRILMVGEGSSQDCSHRHQQDELSPPSPGPCRGSEGHFLVPCGPKRSADVQDKQSRASTAAQQRPFPAVCYGFFGESGSSLHSKAVPPLPPLGPLCGKSPMLHGRERSMSFSRTQGAAGKRHPAKYVADDVRELMTLYHAARTAGSVVDAD